MNNTIEIPVEEYEAMKEQISLLKDNNLLEKMNRLIELLYEDKYGVYLGDNTQDLTEASVQKNWPPQNSPWDNV
ncbi:MAG: hypothetical protein ABI208_08480 [Ginsengibacter sp.]